MGNKTSKYRGHHYPSDADLPTEYLYPSEKRRGKRRALSESYKAFSDSYPVIPPGYPPARYYPQYVPYPQMNPYYPPIQYGHMVPPPPIQTAQGYPLGHRPNASAPVIPGTTAPPPGHYHAPPANAAPQQQPPPPPPAAVAPEAARPPMQMQMPEPEPPAPEPEPYIPANSGNAPVIPGDPDARGMPMPQPPVTPSYARDGRQRFTDFYRPNPMHTPGPPGHTGAAPFVPNPPPPSQPPVDPTPPPGMGQPGVIPGMPGMSGMHGMPGMPPPPPDMGQPGVIPGMPGMHGMHGMPGMPPPPMMSGTMGGPPLFPQRRPNPLPRPPSDIWDKTPYRAVLQSLPREIDGMLQAHLSDTDIDMSDQGRSGSRLGGLFKRKKKNRQGSESSGFGGGGGSSTGGAGGLFRTLSNSMQGHGSRSSSRQGSHRRAHTMHTIVVPPGNAMPHESAGFGGPPPDGSEMEPQEPIRFNHEGPLAGFVNHSHHRVMWKNKIYPTALHLLEAMKFINHRPDLAERIRKTTEVTEMYPLSASFQEHVRPDWGSMFLRIMENVLYEKFKQHQTLRTLLFDTGAADIIFDDVNTFWGGGEDGDGANELGKALVRVRDRLQAEPGL